MFNRVLVVCVGNIYRSPTTKRLLRRFHPVLMVSSIGLGALVGRGAGPCAINVVQAHGLSLDNYCARQVTGRMCQEYDLILTMGKRHIFALCEMVPEMRSKMTLFGHWDNEYEIPGPYRKSRDSLDAMYALPGRSARQWAQALNAEQGKQ